MVGRVAALWLCLLVAGCTDAPSAAVDEDLAPDQAQCHELVRHLTPDGWRAEAPASDVRVAFALNPLLVGTRAGPVEADGNLILPLHDPIEPGWVQFNWTMSVVADPISVDTRDQAAIHLGQMLAAVTVPSVLTGQPATDSTSWGGEERTPDPFFRDGIVTLDLLGFTSTATEGLGAFYAMYEPGTEHVSTLTAKYCDEP